MNLLSFDFVLSTSFPSWWEITPHLISIIVSTLITVFVVLFINFKLKKVDAKKQPTYFETILENLVETFDNYCMGVTNGRMQKLYPFFFSLFIFIATQSTMDLLGFIPGAGSLAFTLTLSSISFLGIIIVGIVTNGFIGFVKKKYSNPIEVFTQFSPLLSLGFRLFGATLSMIILSAILPEILLSLGVADKFVTTALPFISITFQWFLLGFGTALALIQALVFVSLTMVYWTEVLPEKEKKVKTKNKNEIKKQELKERGE